MLGFQIPTVLLAAVVFLGSVFSLEAAVPEYTVGPDGIRLRGVSSANPVIYDNDWWKDVPDASYLWTKASQGKADLRGNIISRDMWDWEKGYLYRLEDSVKDARSLIEAARASGLKNIPDPILGANRVLTRPVTGKIEGTQFETSAGSDLIVAEARKADPSKPMLVFVGGPCTTVATAYLSDPSIADRIIVFQVDGGGYNGNDNWAWQIAQQRLKFVNWARGYFWGDWSHWNSDQFQKLPSSPLGDLLRGYATSDLGKANQWGDGAWIFAIFEPRCITQIEQYDDTAITVPRSGNHTDLMEAEFFATMRSKND